MESVHYRNWIEIQRLRTVPDHYLKTALKFLSETVRNCHYRIGNTVAHRYCNHVSVTVYRYSSDRPVLNLRCQLERLSVRVRKILLPLYCDRSVHGRTESHTLKFLDHLGRTVFQYFQTYGDYGTHTIIILDDKRQIVKTRLGFRTIYAQHCRVLGQKFGLYALQTAITFYKCIHRMTLRILDMELYLPVLVAAHSNIRLRKRFYNRCRIRTCRHRDLIGCR